MSLLAATHVPVLQKVAEAMSVIDDLLDVVSAAPCLPGARCRGRHALFDCAGQDEPTDVVEARHAQALGLCEHCPAATRCQSWLDSLPPNKRPAGVVAGRLVHHPPRKETA